ncbi:MAG: hypothetical protein IJ746_00045 [Ruminococcus sp.]|nr:hypothetical protein [Ruminococcus sp.]
MSNKDILLDIIGEADEELIPELEQSEIEVKPRRGRLLMIAAAACAAVIAAAVILPRTGLFEKRPKTAASEGPAASAEIPESSGSSQGSEPREPAVDLGAYQLAKAEYPAIPRYPEDEFDEKAYAEWSEAVSGLRKNANSYAKGYNEFFKNSAPVFLSGSEGENAVYSPLGLYMALSMTAELTDGATRQQLLDALCLEDMEDLRSGARGLWLANYMDDGMAKCLLANSLWMNEKLGSAYNRDTLALVAENYFAEAFSGDTTSEDYTRAFQSWLSDSTGGLLDDYISDMKLDPETVLTLASTVDYCGKWIDGFSAELTKSAVFHGPKGDAEREFMNSRSYMDYYWGDSFGAVELGLENNGSMRLLLPDEGVSPEDLLTDSEATAFMLSKNFGYKNRKHCEVKLSVPKFDVSSSLHLREGLEALGITDLFDPKTSDFSPLTEEVDNIYVSGAEQDTRVTIDEEGCRASSLTVMQLAGAAMPDGTVEFTLDRPFLFEIISATGQPLFIGIVNEP